MVNFLPSKIPQLQNNVGRKLEFSLWMLGFCFRQRSGHSVLQYLRQSLIGNLPILDFDAMCLLKILEQSLSQLIRKRRFSRPSIAKPNHLRLLIDDKPRLCRLQICPHQIPTIPLFLPILLFWPKFNEKEDLHWWRGIGGEERFWI